MYFMLLNTFINLILCFKTYLDNYKLFFIKMICIYRFNTSFYTKNTSFYSKTTSFCTKSTLI